MKRTWFAALPITLALLSSSILANPIPVPTPASMLLEEMSIVIGADRHVSFNGAFTFDSIRATVSSMLFPLPPTNASGIEVCQDGVELPWSLVAANYPTVLPEYPYLSLFEWASPFPEDGAIFTVDYEHDLFQQRLATGHDSYVTVRPIHARPYSGAGNCGACATVAARGGLAGVGPCEALGRSIEELGVIVLRTYATTNAGNRHTTLRTLSWSGYGSRKTCPSIYALG